MKWWDKIKNQSVRTLSVPVYKRISNARTRNRVDRCVLLNLLAPLCCVLKISPERLILAVPLPLFLSQRLQKHDQTHASSTKGSCGFLVNSLATPGGLGRLVGTAIDKTAFELAGGNRTLPSLPLYCFGGLPTATVCPSGSAITYAVKACRICAHLELRGEFVVGVDKPLADQRCCVQIVSLG